MFWYFLAKNKNEWASLSAYYVLAQECFIYIATDPPTAFLFGKWGHCSHVG